MNWRGAMILSLCLLLACPVAGLAQEEKPSSKGQVQGKGQGQAQAQSQDDDPPPMGVHEKLDDQGEGVVIHSTGAPPSRRRQGRFEKDRQEGLEVLRNIIIDTRSAPPATAPKP